jgi:putative DNA primase/helicase
MIEPTPIRGRLNGTPEPEYTRPDYGIPDFPAQLMITLPGSWECTDVGNAKALVDCFGDQLRYDMRKKRWLRWNDHRWEPDGDTGQRILPYAISAAGARFFRHFGDTRSDGDAQKKHAAKSQSRGALQAAVDIARSLLPIRDEGDTWDTEPMLLGLPNGVLDLNDDTWNLRGGHPDDHITLNLGTPLDLDAECPRWEQFLTEITDNDPVMVAYLRRAIGYTLSGSCDEDALFMCLGTGANGKSVFLETLTHLMGDYATNLPASALEKPARGQTASPYDLAHLPGKRLATIHEVATDSRLDERRIKPLTSGDKMTVRDLYESFYEFVPQAKIWMALNHRPDVTDTSEGFWRRIHLIRFPVTFGTDEHPADKDLAVKLREELPGILRWALRGWIDYRDQRSLNPPPAIVAATEEYRLETNQLRRFLEEKCDLTDDGRVYHRDLIAAYTRWCDSYSETQEIPARKLRPELADLGIRHIDSNNMPLTYRGIALKPEPTR